jgi:integral membrane sensor domain MASE1
MERGATERGDLSVLRDSLLAGLVWSLVALGNVAVRDQLGAVILLWMPSAVALAAFYAVRQKH